MITFDDFTKIEMKIGEVEAAEVLANSNKLIKLTVNFGNEKRQAVAGIKEYYAAEDLVGKKFVFVTNLQPRKMMGLDSNCMILAANDGNGNVVLLQPEKDVKVGSSVQ